MINIPERAMYYAERLSDRKVIKGYYCGDNDMIDVETASQPMAEIDIETLEPVAIAPIKDTDGDLYCPNCEREFPPILFDMYDMENCIWCGQNLAEADMEE